VGISPLADFDRRPDSLDDAPPFNPRRRRIIVVPWAILSFFSSSCSFSSSSWTILRARDLFLASSSSSHPRPMRRSRNR